MLFQFIWVLIYYAPWQVWSDYGVTIKKWKHEGLVKNEYYQFDTLDMLLRN